MVQASSFPFDDLEWVEVNPTLRKTVLNGKRMTVTRYRFGGGGRFPLHSHDQEQVTYVISGTMTFIVEGVEHVVGAGSMIIIPPLARHEAQAGAAGAEVLSVVAPPRTDERDISILEKA
jgi:quercetin dioxygenase-like cupin family protein